MPRVQINVFVFIVACLKKESSQYLRSSLLLWCACQLTHIFHNKRVMFIIQKLLTWTMHKIGQSIDDAIYQFIQEHTTDEGSINCCQSLVIMTLFFFHYRLDCVFTCYGRSSCRYSGGCRCNWWEFLVVFFVCVNVWCGFIQSSLHKHQ